MICIIDYGAGNIESVRKALEYIGAECVVSSDANVLMNSDAAILPGVGSFGDAMENLRARNLEKPISEFVKSGKPFLGICLGLQILFESSEESPGVRGLSLLKGKIVRIPDGEGLKIPHMGWNSLNIEKQGGLFKDIPDNPYVYFVHSYYLRAEEDIVTSTAEYGITIHASVAKENLWACQFHPEKSGELGIELLKNFVGKIEVE
ncbi:MAG: imidazole glycerol phosphate synthase subunit HisH [Clostridia bacterium]|nr:imidazole glycerol phosphate synthase subunit HisH [Clostridia bacterium]